MLGTSEIIFVCLLGTSGDTITILIIAKGVKLFFNVYRGHGDESGHVLGTVFVGGVPEDGRAHVAGPAVPAGTAMCAHLRTSFRFSVFCNFVTRMKKVNLLRGAVPLLVASF